MNPYTTSPLETKHRRSGVDFVDRAGWRMADHYTAPESEFAAVQQGVGLMDLSPNGKLALKGSSLPEFLERAFGIDRYAVGNLTQVEYAGKAIHLAALTAEEVLLLTPLGQEGPLMDFINQKLGEFFVSFVDRTGGLGGLLLAGPRSRPVMSKLCALSFHPHDFPNCHVAQTSFAKVRATILRRDLRSLPAFELYFDRSYAEYLWDTLLDAGREFSLQPLGWQTLKLLQDGNSEK